MSFAPLGLCLLAVTSPPDAGTPKTTPPASGSGLAAPSPAASPSAPSPAELVERMQRFYDKTRDFKAEFRQTLSSTLYGRKQVFDGVVYFKKPGKMRWDYKTPEPKLFVSDGKTFWIYDPEDAQAFKQPIADAQLPTAITFLFGTGKLAREFDVHPVDDPKPFGASGDYLVKLVPKQPSTRYKEIVFAIAPKTFEATQTFVYDLQGNINQVSFLKSTVNSKLADSLFAWTPPPGTKVVRPVP